MKQLRPAFLSEMDHYAEIPLAPILRLMHLQIPSLNVAYSPGVSRRKVYLQWQ